jgi:hypothetical protein
VSRVARLAIFAEAWAAFATAEYGLWCVGTNPDRIDRSRRAAVAAQPTTPADPINTRSTASALSTFVSNDSLCPTKQKRG